MTGTPTRRSGSRQFWWRGLGRRVAVTLGFCLALALGAQDAGAVRSGAAVTPPKWAASIVTPSGACSGTIVGNGWVLTAAHCLYRNDGIIIPAGSFTVRLGRKSHGAPAVAYKVDSRTPMPGYADLRANDAAMLHLVGFDASRWDALPLARSRADVHTAGPLSLFGYGDNRIDASRRGSGARRTSPGGAFFHSNACWSKEPMRTRYVCVLATAGAKVVAGDSGAGWLRLIDGRLRLIAVHDWSYDNKRVWHDARPASTPYAIGTSTLAVTSAGQTLLGWVQATAALPTPVPGQIVRASDTGAAWLIDAAGNRNRIPDDGTYQCLVAQGHAVYRGENGLRQIDADTIPEQIGALATCSASVNPPVVPGAPVTCWDGSVIFAPQACPAEPATVRCWDGSFVTRFQLCPREPPDKMCWNGSIYPGYEPCPPEVWWKRQSPAHAAKTYMDYHNASGLGQAIVANQFVSVSCRVFDANSASANPGGWWYRIASSPWSDQYYSPAGGFSSASIYNPHDSTEVALCP